MVKPMIKKAKKGEAVEKRISLTVLPQDPGNQDIRVEVTRNLSRKKQKSNRRLAVFLFLVMLFYLFPMAWNLLAYFNMKQDYEELQVYNRELLSLQRQLEEEKEALYSPEMIERLAREELDLVMPGESKVYQAIPTTGIPQRVNPRSNEVFH